MFLITDLLICNARETWRYKNLCPQLVWHIKVVPPRAARPQVASELWVMLSHQIQLRQKQVEERPAARTGRFREWMWWNVCISGYSSRVIAGKWRSDLSQWFDMRHFIMMHIKMWNGMWTFWCILTCDSGVCHCFDWQVQHLGRNMISTMSDLQYCGGIISCSTGGRWSWGKQGEKAFLFVSLELWKLWHSSKTSQAWKKISTWAQYIIEYTFCPGFFSTPTT